MTDIKLDDNVGSVTIECDTLISTGDSLDVRSSANTPASADRRRAITHTADDGLSINAFEDYANGVRLSGVRRIRGRADKGLEITEASSITGRADGLELAGVSTIAGRDDAGLELTQVHFIEGVPPNDPIGDNVTTAIFPNPWTSRVSIGGDIQIQLSPQIFVGPGASTWTSLQTVIKTLQDRVNELERRLDAKG